MALAPLHAHSVLLALRYFRLQVHPEVPELRRGSDDPRLGGPTKCGMCSLIQGVGWKVLGIGMRSLSNVCVFVCVCLMRTLESPCQVWTKPTSCILVMWALPCVYLSPSCPTLLLSGGLSVPGWHCLHLEQHQPLHLVRLPSPPAGAPAHHPPAPAPAGAPTGPIPLTPALTPGPHRPPRPCLHRLAGKRGKVGTKIMV